MKPDVSLSETSRIMIELIFKIFHCVLCILGYLECLPEYQMLLIRINFFFSFEAAKTAFGWIGDSTTSVNSLSPQMSELVKGCSCFLMRWHSWAFLAHQEWAPETCRAQIWIFQFQHFRCLSDILATSCTNEVSVCWILNNALCSMTWVLSGFDFVQHCEINIWHHMLCYLPNIYNYITFTASLERVQF